MTKPTDSGPSSRRGVFAAGLAGAVAALAAVYVIAGPNGNTANGESCKIALQAAAAAKPFATGEVAAFLPAQKPLGLSEIAFLGPHDELLKMSDFAGKTVLLNLWATWCAPCRKEMPALDKLQADLGSEEFEVVAVNLDRGGPEKPKAFLQEIGVSRLGYYHDSSNRLLQDLRAKARATGLPTTILIGPEGCEIGTMYGPAEWADSDAVNLIRAAMAPKAGS
ncbi:thiol-disulfide isomerase/thioredoxin [Roseibium hamelinense]|uniref:Thiol-disulfide isomerase/thioredoxin n=1 Tax=Roseibium hamelinense TaxID=150831 RepID=A0A562SN78_9HYPH|nr:TlpA disulfide reductase family protein [Roseibium hamelinense]MTI44033.1 TlpA family protein disulfide reductase [Roseibium hamelinense]TWI82759.1 thiol-disulfide isomerase/thioredoxin [Roseibium hamelinense]